MGCIKRKTVTKPLPAGAEIIERKGERLARWRSKRGKMQTAPVTTGRDGSDRIVVESSGYIAKYRDGSGVVREVSTGCRDEAAARRILGELERRAELVKAGVLTSEEDAVADAQPAPLAEHIDAYIAHQTAKGVNADRVKSARQRLETVAADCKFAKLSDLNPDKLIAWLQAQADKKMSAGARNGYREAWIGFANWCTKSKPRRLIENPFKNVPKADAKSDCRRKRRAMTEPELLRLLEVARERPLQDAMTVRRGKRKGQAFAKLRDETRARLALLGRERALIYKTLVLTGLRKGELASLTVGQLDLDGPVPLVQLNAADEKNREGNSLPLRADLADDLRDWLADRLAAQQHAAHAAGEPLPARLPADSPLFTVPDGLLRILNRDLKSAGIPKRDERGRTVDVHAMRHTFGTLLSKGGVAPRTAQAAMRHSHIDLTMNVYTDPKLLDVHGSLDALPALPLEDRHSVSKFAPQFAPTGGKLGQTESLSDHASNRPDAKCNPREVAENPGKQAKNARRSRGSAGVSQVGATRRLLNFFWPASAAGKPDCGGRWMTTILPTNNLTSAFGRCPARASGD